MDFVTFARGQARCKDVLRDAGWTVEGKSCITAIQIQMYRFCICFTSSFALILCRDANKKFHCQQFQVIK